MNVLISSRVYEHPKYDETFDALSHDWSHVFSKNGLKPILVPNWLDSVESLLSFEPRGLILSGGNDIGEYRSNPLEFINLRDRLEYSLITLALSNSIPILGVCRGFQLLNICFGGTVSRTIAHGHAGTFHEVEIVGKLNNLEHGKKFTVNSYHNQGVTIEQLAADMVVFAQHGNIVEGFYHKEKSIIGIQWHPERENAKALDLDHEIFDWWLSK